MKVEGFTVEQLRTFLADKPSDSRVVIGALGATEIKPIVSAEWKWEDGAVILFPLPNTSDA